MLHTPLSNYIEIMKKKFYFCGHSLHMFSDWERRKSGIKYLNDLTRSIICYTFTIIVWGLLPQDHMLLESEQLLQHQRLPDSSWEPKMFFMFILTCKKIYIYHCLLIHCWRKTIIYSFLLFWVARRITMAWHLLNVFKANHTRLWHLLLS